MPDIVVPSAATVPSIRLVPAGAGAEVEAEHPAVRIDRAAEGDDSQDGARPALHDRGIWLPQLREVPLAGLRPEELGAASSRPTVP